MTFTRIALSITAVLAGHAHADSFTSQHLWTFHHTAESQSKSMGSEIVAYDDRNQRIWVVGTDANEKNEGKGGIDILDLTGNLVHGIDTSALGGINSVALGRNQAAVAITAPNKTDPGLVRLFNVSTFNSVADITVGANPDSLTYTKDGSRILVANEGEPSAYGVPGGDPEGSVDIINSKTFKTQSARFSAFNADYDTLKQKGVRLSGPDATVAQDLEPEYIAISADGKRAMVTLQENNALAVVDIKSAKIKHIQPLGFKDHTLPDNALDVSDKDDQKGNLKNWQAKGMFMPDGIASFVQKNKQYYVIANEGDGRDWQGWVDESRVKDAAIDATLQAQLLEAHGADWKKDANLGRLTVSKSGDLDGDGDLDELQVYGARSFSIVDQNGTLIFDSANQIERIIQEKYPALWDDGRSDNKGPEPESAVIGKVGSHTLLFLGLERSNAIMVWDLSDLKKISFLNLLLTQGDVGPEGLSFFNTKQGSFLAVANEVSETTSLYRVSMAK
jgi:DNA-binding beta-propeller fold protein YncE